jgi:hypothetical protein
MKRTLATLAIAMVLGLAACGGMVIEEESDVRAAASALSAPAGTRTHAAPAAPAVPGSDDAIPTDRDCDVSGTSCGKGGRGRNPDPGGEDEPTDPVVLIVHR